MARIFWSGLRVTWAISCSVRRGLCWSRIVIVVRSSGMFFRSVITTTIRVVGVTVGVISFRVMRSVG